jgi:plastocyanin
VEKVMRTIVLAVIATVASGRVETRPRPDTALRDTVVSIRTFQFRPASLVVPAGTRVVWSNADDIEHTVTAGTPDSASGGFTGSVKMPGATFAHTFLRPGTYAYFCDRHHFMRGEVRVTSTGEN